jgi:hypothetical protein
MAFTYDPDTALGQVRELIGDTDDSADAGVKPDGSNFTDAQVSNALSRANQNVKRAAADLCETLATMWAGQAGRITIGRYVIDSSATASRYAEMAKQLRSAGGVIFEVY